MRNIKRIWCAQCKINHYLVRKIFEPNKFVTSVINFETDIDILIFCQCSFNLILSLIFLSLKKKMDLGIKISKRAHYFEDITRLITRSWMTLLYTMAILSTTYDVIMTGKTFRLKVILTSWYICNVYSYFTRWNWLNINQFLYWINLF